MISGLVALAFYGKIVQSWHCYFGPDDSVLWKAVLSILGCLAASLVSTYHVPVASLPSVMTTKISLGIAKWPLRGEGQTAHG